MRIKHEILNVHRFEGFRLVDIYCYYIGHLLTSLFVRKKAIKQPLPS